MFKPQQYNKCNKLQADVNTQILKKYENITNWKNSNCETIIDLGSGDGSFTSQGLVKFLPESSKIIGVDKFSDMVQFANDNYKTKRISFQIMDIGGTLPLEFHNSFNYVFSFYATQLVQDQVQAFTNVYNLLAPGGSCLIAMVGRTKMFECYHTLRKMSKWQQWLFNVQDIISVYAECINPKQTIENILKEAGFNRIQVDVKDALYKFENISDFKDFMTGINSSKMPVDMYEDYLNDFVNVAQSNGFLNDNLQVTYESIVVVANK